MRRVTQIWTNQRARWGQSDGLGMVSGLGLSWTIIRPLLTAQSQNGSPLFFSLPWHFSNILHAVANATNQVSDLVLFLEYLKVNKVFKNVEIGNRYFWSVILRLIYILTF